MTIQKSKSDLERSLRALQTEAGGSCSLAIVQHDDVGPLAVSAASGNADAWRLINAIETALTNMRKAPRHLAPLCACCPRSLRRARFTFAVVIPAIGDPSQALCLGICESCAPDGATAFSQACSALRRLWPEFRSIDISHEDGGRA